MKFRTIKDVSEKHLSQQEAAKKLNLSTRQVRRLQKRVQEGGELGVVHGFVGKPSNNSLSTSLRQRIMDLWIAKYGPCGLNFSHFTEKLNEVEGIKVSVDTVRRIIRTANLAHTAPKRRRKHRKLRPRRERQGELLQLDTSPHDWLSTGEKQHLVVMIDDATSKVLFSQLCEHDGTLPNMDAINSVARSYGLPLAIYTDRASWFHYSQQGRKIASHKSLREDGSGVRGETQIGRALNELGVELIPAYSAPAKGRVERVNRTFQDRLISELKLHNITQIELANQFIWERYLDDHNRRFSVAAQCEQSAFVHLANPDCLHDILCLRFESTVRNDNTVSRAKYYQLQLLPSKHRFSWVKAKVEVRIHLDQSISVRHSKTKELIPFEILHLNIPKEPKLGKSALL